MKNAVSLPNRANFFVVFGLVDLLRFACAILFTERSVIYWRNHITSLEILVVLPH